MSSALCLNFNVCHILYHLTLFPICIINRSFIVKEISILNRAQCLRLRIHLRAETRAEKQIMGKERSTASGISPLTQQRRMSYIYDITNNNNNLKFTLF